MKIKSSQSSAQLPSMYTHVRVNHLKTRGMCNIESKNGDIAFVHFKLFRSSFWEGKVTCLKLTINVTFIYYNPHLSKTHI